MILSQAIFYTDGLPLSRQGAWKLVAPIALGPDNLVVLERHIRYTLEPDELSSMALERTTSPSKILRCPSLLHLVLINQSTMNVTYNKG